MPRQSKAEQALSKQCKIIVERMAILRASVEKLEAEMDALSFLHTQLQDEIGQLRDARMLASKQRKPA